MRSLKSAGVAGAVAVVGLLSVRGATAFYMQFTASPQPVAACASASVAGSHGMPSKSERLARAASLVGGMGKQGQVREVFSASDGSTGVIIQSGEGAFVGWMVDGIDALFVGAKFDAHGQNATQAEMLARKLAVPSTAPPAALAQPNAAVPGPDPHKLMQAVGQSAGFIEGTGGPVWTAYVDGNCTFCTQLWRSLRAPIASGRIRVRWAPVAVLGEGSAGKAATVLLSGRPQDVLASHGLTGAAIPASTVTAPIQLQIEANNAMLRALSGAKAPATPTLVLPRGAGEPLIVRGLPPDVGALLREAGV